MGSSAASVCAALMLVPDLPHGDAALLIPVVVSVGILFSLPVLWIGSVSAGYLIFRCLFPKIHYHRCFWFAFAAGLAGVLSLVLTVAVLCILQVVALGSIFPSHRTAELLLNLKILLLSFLYPAAAAGFTAWHLGLKDRPSAIPDGKSGEADLHSADDSESLPLG